MYTDAHRLVVQTFLARGVMNTKDVADVIQKACERCGVTNSGQNVDNFIHQINTKLRINTMEIKKKRGGDWRRSVCFATCRIGKLRSKFLMLNNLQYTFETVGSGMKSSTVSVLLTFTEQLCVRSVVLVQCSHTCTVQTAETEVGKLATDYHPKELELFKEIVGKIVTSEEGEASSTECLNLADSLDRRISKDDAQTAIKKFVEERWLYMDEEGQISLAARGILELEMFMKESYSDFISICYLCQDLVVKGQLCDACGKVKLHYFCCSATVPNQPNPKCPSCEKAWRHQIPRLNGGIL
ncbi:putative non-structural maintenance of chromosomes element 1-like [Apostichopus japonicus]|uniref:Non-structural maintenance of chromosomes element 1 homolog n=1 Tax=Stichopus japonicus TaxID=307972 RepID=A0A2G8KA91_STIJA|nr:putative non-structural maintenance of chromosomes element 1-like [Apostichopus japonicus]